MLTTKLFLQKYSNNENNKRWTFYITFTQGVLASKFPISIRTQTQGQYRCQNVQKILKNHVPVSDFATMLLNLRKTQKSQNFCKKKKSFFRKKMQFDIKETLFRILFFHPWYLHSRKYIFDPKFTIKGCVIMKWGHGRKIWDWFIILHYFAEHLTCMSTLGLRSYRSSNLVIDLKTWEKFESNLPVCHAIR